MLHRRAISSNRRIRAITCDVTGTLVSFLGRIEDHYGDAARICGVDLSPEKKLRIPKCFNALTKRHRKHFLVSETTTLVPRSGGGYA